MNSHRKDVRMPKVSVLLTSFNHEKYLRAAIDSVLNQTFSNFELVIWDDASTDDSWAVINSYSDRRIKAFRNEENKRPIFGVVKAISEVLVGEYVAMHHSDDIWALDKLEKQVSYLDAHAEIGAVFTNVLAIAEDSSPLADEQHFYFGIFQQPNRTRQEWLRFFLNHGNALCHPSVLIRKICYADCGLYRYGLAQFGDLDMWMRLCLKYDIHILPEKLTKFRVRNGEANTSGNRPEARIRGEYERYKLLENYRRITSIEDLTQVFPSAEKFNRKDDTDVDFALAMILLEEKSSAFTPLFCLDFLFAIISDSKRAETIRRLYDFDYQSFITLTKQYDFSYREEIAKRDREIGVLQKEILRIKSTASWKITKPLRTVWNFFRSTFQGK